MPKLPQLLAKAVQLHQSGQLEAAERAYLKLLRADKNNPDGLRLLGCLYLQSNRHEPAFENLTRANKWRPGDPEILNNLGIAARNLNRLDEAAGFYQQAIAAKPDSAQALHNLGSVYYQQGKIAEAAEHYRQALALQSNYAQAHYNLANTLRDQHRYNDAITHYQHTLRIDPRYIDAAINLALALNQKGDVEEACSIYEQTLKRDPDHILILNNYGNLLRSLGRFEQAQRLYEKALRLKPDYLNAHINLGTIHRDLGRLDEARLCYERALAMDPNAVAALINLGTLYQDFNRLEDAADLYDRTLQLNPASIDGLWNRGLVHLALGNYEKGWALYDHGLGTHDKRGHLLFDLARLWDGASFNGKRLLICAEQGLGDSLQFIRYAALCKQRGGRVYVLCPASLQSLFKNDPAIDRIFTKIEPDEFDVFIPMMSLPRIFATRLDTIPQSIPYLKVGEAARQKWQKLMAGTGEGPKVGLVWAGGIRNDQPTIQHIDKRRSIHVSQFRPLLHMAGASFYNLQIGPPAAQIKECGLEDRLIDLTFEIADFEDTAALVEQLDLVIAVDTSIVHLAGGLGKPVWVLSRFDACWRWLRNRKDSPWYPSARIFGQTAYGQWDSVLIDIQKALKDLIAMAHQVHKE